MVLRVAGLVHDSIVDGTGLRTAVFAQGCPHHCPGCHNPETWPFKGGTPMETEALAEEALKAPWCAGVTLTGGEPFAQAEAMADLAARVRAGGKTVWTFTGYTYEQLAAMREPAVPALLRHTNVLVDGPFILAQRSIERPFCGSLNQRVLTLRDGEIQAG